MTTERFLITGATGCIGAWVVRNLIKEGVETWILNRGTDFHRLKLILSEDEFARIRMVKGDIAEFEDVNAAFQQAKPTHLIHLAAMQFPFCKADPVLGAKVNVVGTVNFFEAAKRAGNSRLVFASSTSVYGTVDEYPDEPLAHNALLKPHSHYGVYKQANEGTSQVYWLDDGITSIGLRPYVVYGPGRDQGMSSTPTRGMLAAAKGEAYRITFGCKIGFQYVDDVAKIFIQAARSSFKGCDSFNIGGETVHVSQIVDAINAADPSVQGLITFEDKSLGLPEEVDNAALEKLLSPLTFTPLVQGVKETMDIFKQGLKDHKV
jgi:UDP-glucuronate 4-epimerase